MPKFGEKQALNPVAEEEKRIAHQKGLAIVSDTSLEIRQKIQKLDSLRALALSVGKTTRAKVYAQLLTEQKKLVLPPKSGSAFLPAGKAEKSDGSLGALAFLVPSLAVVDRIAGEYEKAVSQPKFGSYSLRALANCADVRRLSELIGIGREETAKYIMGNAERIGQWMENLKKDRGMPSISMGGVEFKGPRADVSDDELARVCAMALVGEKALGVQAEFTLNIINQESQFRFDASWSGGVGGMQLTSNSVVQFNPDVIRSLKRWLKGRGLEFVDDWKYVYIKDESRGQSRYVRTSLVRGEGRKSMPPEVREELASSPVLNMFYGMLHLAYIMEKKGDDDMYIVARSYNGNLKVVRGAREIIKVCDDYARKVKGRLDWPWPNFCYSDEGTRKFVKNMKKPEKWPSLASAMENE